MKEYVVKILFVLRIILWIIALGATAYWIWWSFELYLQGHRDVKEYSGLLRPVFAKGLAVSLVCVVVSLILRSVSDRLKNRKL